MKKIKVLMVGNSSTVKGGITSVISQILEHDWLSEGIDMKFIPTYVETNNVFKILYFAKAYRKIAHEIRVYKPDVVHIHMSYKGSFMRKYAIHKLCKKKGIRDIIHLHGSEFEKWYNESDDAKKMKIRCLLRECDSFIVLGDKWNHVIKGIEPKTKTVVVSNTVKIPEETIKRSFSCFQILFLGVLIKRKGVEDLLNAVKQLVDTRKLDNIKVVVAGTGAEEQNLKRQTKELNIESYIEFAGWTAGDKKNHYYVRASFLFCHLITKGFLLQFWRRSVTVCR